MSIGVLALQGDFEAHRRALADLDAHAVEVRTAAELSAVDGLILPGGESTTMLKLLTGEGLFEPLRAFVSEKPTLGTCAGAILLAKETLSPSQASLGVLDITIERNAYGRQIDSSIRKVRTSEAFVDETAPGDIDAVFIRAPIIRRVGDAVETLASDGDVPVLVRQKRVIAATFHPELTADRRVHRLFLDTIEEAK